MKPNKEKIYDFIRLHANQENQGGVSTQYIAQVLNMQRTNVSSVLARLVDEGRIGKSNGRPVLYYIQEDSQDGINSCFRSMIGADGSLKRAVSLAKAAVLYPPKSLNTLIIGAKGTGKNLLAHLMYQFGIQNQVFASEALFIVYSCKEYIGHEELALEELFGDGTQSGCFRKAAKGVLYIDQVQYLSTRLRRMIAKHIEAVNMNLTGNNSTEPLVIISCDAKNPAVSEDFKASVPITIELPLLSERPLKERMEMIQNFFTLEAARIKRTLVIKEELLRCLLLYECEANCLQLKADIKIGCANAYVRAYKSKDSLQLFISDFEHHVRTGFLKYNTYREEIEQLIPSNYSYTFGEDSIKMSAVNKEKLKGSTIYDEISRKASIFNASGLKENEINLLLSTEVETIFRRYQKELTKEVTNKEQLSILVDKRIISLVEEFLEQASQALGRSFLDSVFYSLCLHINSVICKQAVPNKLAPKQLANILQNYKTEYLLSTEFAAKLKDIFKQEIPIEEIVLITMFISYQAPVSESLNKPVILFAFYGEGVAVSITKTITALTHIDNVFAYELAFTNDTEEIYDSLKQFIQKINRGKGVIVVYDSSFLSEMLISIQEDLNIMIRQLPLPITTIGIELAREASINENTDLVYQEVLKNVSLNSMELQNVIVAICTTGKGGAEELKHYMEEYGGLVDTKVITITYSDTDTIKENFAALMKDSSILCVVGTYDPKIYSLPFLSISEVFGTPKEKLHELLYHKQKNKVSIDYDSMFQYLSEQLTSVNIERLRKVLLPVLSDMNEQIWELSQDTEIGLLIHIACCIDRMLSSQPTPVNVRKDMILSQYHGQYRKLIKVLKPVEKAFHIIFNEDEIANILTIIYKL